MQGVLACCNPIPPLVKTELLTMHTIIRAAREQKLLPVLEESVEQQLPQVQLQMEELNTGLVISKHDLSTVEENPTDLPTLLNPRETLLGDLFSQPRIDVRVKEKSRMFGCVTAHLKHKDSLHREITKEFMSPYERYTAYQDLKPHLDGERKKREEPVDEAHIARVKKHFLCLSNNTPQEKSEEEAQVVHKPKRPRPAKEQKKIEMNTPILLRDEIKEMRATNSAAKRSAENEGEAADGQNDESPSKRLKADEADGKSKEGGKERKEDKKVEDEGKEKKKEEEEKEKGEEEEEGACTDSEMEEKLAAEGASSEGGGEGHPMPFDYDKADYSIFEGKVGKKFKSKQQYQQKFGGRGQRGRGFKSNMKSFSFGRGKAGRGGSRR
ncbi:exosome complex component 10 homolog [Penaeus indicus]|uniref:exosome complex component 10 homolog n=1 Tax=Penaeus indicus TaxID=29960 RepID=UPI00300C5141